MNSKPNSKPIPVTAACLALLAALGSTPAEATTLSLDTGKAVSLAPGGSADFVLSFSNVDAGDVTADFFGWVLGLQVLPSAGAGGTVTIGTLAPASTNSIFAVVGVDDISQPDALTLAGGALLNGTSAFSGMSMLGSAPATAVSGASYNLGSLGLTAAANASGTWNVFAVQQASPNMQSYYFNGEISEVDFGNLLRTGGNSALLLGTVTVVPEPAIPGAIVMLAATALWWRRRGLAGGHQWPRHEPVHGSG